MAKTFFHTHRAEVDIDRTTAERVELAAARKRVPTDDILRRVITLGLPLVEAEIEAPDARLTR
jgi:hypothetical protein